MKIIMGRIYLPLMAPLFHPAQLCNVLLYGLSFLFLAGSPMSSFAGVSEAPTTFRLPTVLFDYYRHSEPQLPLGQHILTGGYQDNVGRYGLNDFAHSNSFDPLFQTLGNDYNLIAQRSPLSPKVLADADIVVIFTPASPKSVPDIPLISDHEIDALEQWVEDGGSLLLMANSYHTTENFEPVQFRKLFQRFGLDWVDDDTRYVNLPVSKENPFFYDIDVFHYGAGCTLSIDPASVDRVDVMLRVHGDSNAPDVEGPGLVLARHGRGKVMAVGDTGSWTANLSRPGVQNTAFIKQMFHWLAPDRAVMPPTFQPGESMTYRFQATAITLVPTANSLNQIDQPNYRHFEPRPRTQIPFIETSGMLTVACERIDQTTGAVTTAVDTTHFSVFDEAVPMTGTTKTTVISNQRGALVEWNAGEGANAVVGPDALSLFAFLPTDGIHPGTRWQKMETLTVPAFRANDPGPSITIPIDTNYRKDTQHNGRTTRLFLSEGRMTLREAGIQSGDLIPGNSRSTHYRYRHPDGGDLHVKRKTWIDSETGRVLRAKTQTRVTTWIEDTRNPPAADATVDTIDNMTLAILSRVVEFDAITSD